MCICRLANVVFVLLRLLNSTEFSEYTITKSHSLFESDTTQKI